jgi:hypothetical protein
MKKNLSVTWSYVKSIIMFFSEPQSRQALDKRQGRPQSPQSDDQQHWKPQPSLFWLSCIMITSVLSTLLSSSSSSHSYTTTEIISSMQIITDQYTENQLVTSSHSGVALQSSLVICVLKSFLPLDYCLAASNAVPRSLTKAFPTKFLSQARAIPHTMVWNAKPCPKLLCQ